MTYISWSIDFALYLVIDLKLFLYFIKWCQPWVLVTLCALALFPYFSIKPYVVGSHLLHQSDSVESLSPTIYIFNSPEQRFGRALLYYPRHWHQLWHWRPQMFKFYIKVFRTSFFPNPVMDLVHIWYVDRYWSKILRSTIHTPYITLRSRSQT